MFKTFQSLVLNKNYIKSISCKNKVLPLTDNVVNFAELLYSQVPDQMYCFELYDNALNVSRPLKQNSRSHNIAIEPTGCQQMLVPNHHPEPVVAYGETNPQYFKLNNANLCTIDITNVYYSDCSNHSDIYHVYLHKKTQQKSPGFYFLKRHNLTGHMDLIQCHYSHAGPSGFFQQCNYILYFLLLNMIILPKFKAKGFIVTMFRTILLG